MGYRKIGKEGAIDKENRLLGTAGEAEGGAS